MTRSGGIFYTGTSSCGSNNGGTGGFFRYVSANGGGALTEIARDWWNFIYEPVSSATGDKAIFFGPDPTSASTASWNTACLFAFDPQGGSTAAARTSPVITCGGDIWSWMQLSRPEDIATYGQGFNGNSAPSQAYKTEYATRCTSAGQVFAGGGSQINAIKQDSTGQIYVIGNVRKKNAGTLRCNIELRGPHCKVDGSPDFTRSSPSDCTNVSGTWVDDGTCQGQPASSSQACFDSHGTWNRNSVWYNDVGGAICTSDEAVAPSDWWSQDNALSFQTALSAEENLTKIKLNNLNCSAPASAAGGDPWTSEYRGLAKVDAASKTLILLSTTDEQAVNLWLIDDHVYYSAYNTTLGRYLLKGLNGSAPFTLVENFETYNLSRSGDANGLYYDGLDFATNSYSFGTLSQQAPYLRTQKAGLTGTLKTIVILPHQ